MTATSLPAALVDRGIGRLLCRERRRRPRTQHVYFEDEPGRRSAAKLLKARRIIAKLPRFRRA